MTEREELVNEIKKNIETLNTLDDDAIECISIENLTGILEKHTLLTREETLEMINRIAGSRKTVRFKVDKMFILQDSGKLKGFADVSVNNSIVIRGVRILEGKKGTFIAMPQGQGKDEKWCDQVLCTGADVFEELSDVVLDHYKKQKEETHE